MFKRARKPCLPAHVDSACTHVFDTAPAEARTSSTGDSSVDLQPLPLQSLLIPTHQGYIMCFDIGIVVCGPNEALVISGMFQVNHSCS